ncbi:hypothetical protein BV20DRAFT_967136 [Pilatotrama ljubarskyi]|nr:hypothetical protein BV20DRAFT_967136 [Pilatotrama ljubarskyi]
MFFMQFLVALSVLVLGAQAAPAAKRDASATSTSVLTVPSGFGNTTVTVSGLTAGATISPDALLSLVQANEATLLSAVGTQTVQIAEANAVMAQAATAIPPSETQLSLFMADVDGTLLVEVSSIGGPGITLATGTASGVPTTFAGYLFTAAPKTNYAITGFQVPRALIAGAATIVGSVFIGAMAVL